ncbi:60S ribosomal protein L28 [Quaeritorhiza haematococci]|nr:60S ribosomal protein L28 [Quaeritorhiza haematococci]
MSCDLVWLITRSNSSFLVKRNGVEFSRQSGNLYNLNSFKYSSVATEKSVAVAPAANNKGVVVSLKKKKVPSTKPATSVFSTTIAKDARRTSKAVKNLVHGYRPDLEKAALARVSRILASQKTTRVAKPKKVRGVRAARKA